MGKKRKYIVYTFLFFCIFFSIISCRSSKNTLIDPDSIPIRWCDPWTPSDTSNYSHGCSANRTCFPGYKLHEDDYEKISVNILDRHGSEIYSSSTFTENWICNGDSNFSFIEGTYYYIILLSTGETANLKDTLRGAIRLYRKDYD